MRNKAGETPLDVVNRIIANQEITEEMTPQERANVMGRKNTRFFLRGVVIDEYDNASRRNDVAFTERLMDAYPEFKNALSHGKTPLYRAVEKNNAEVARALLANGAQPDVAAVTDAGRTPLHRAVLGGSEEFVRMLLEAGADVTVTNALGETPLDIASKQGRHAIAILLQSAAVKEFEAND